MQGDLWLERILEIGLETGTRSLLIDLTSTTITDDIGSCEAAFASKIARDMTDPRRAEQQQHMLIRENDHRIKNLFALASGIVSLSARFAATNLPQTPVKDLIVCRYRAPPPQVIALSKVTTLGDLIGTVIQSYVGPSSRYELSGPDMKICGSALTSITLLLHEFAARTPNVVVSPVLIHVSAMTGSSGYSCRLHSLPSILACCALSICSLTILRRVSQERVPLLVSGTSASKPIPRPNYKLRDTPNMQGVGSVCRLKSKFA
ncbi:hypothetical protein [Phyllobacterium endophyticum]|uniref:histidine kinase n=1 Tax=Phyllobacterium endophyticum TaxID=1149773 RepID=A0A2P7AR33_9HYPH|nr:hypothetical protein [Phyllobacterium endophyticum]MBB3237329.1 hypothetical protein [Phyllobacterium endophyticum]PSH56689.1 hypothetical protein CU100_15145 [Phyllobacterium endophyticum]TYR44323.1 hypothetical protein FY050_04055 [Phyllobacterium endophyticum]